MANGAPAATSGYICGHLLEEEEEEEEEEEARGARSHER
jgi:hypothetical protein